MAKVEIELDAQGFENLFEQSMAWAGQDWPAQDGRFEPAPSYDFKWAYFYDRYIDALISLSFLNTIGEKATIHSDEATGWLIITNYASPCHLR
jgi:hypothetical protein